MLSGKTKVKVPNTVHQMLQSVLHTTRRMKYGHSCFSLHKSTLTRCERHKREQLEGAERKEMERGGDGSPCQCLSSAGVLGLTSAQVLSIQEKHIY